MIQPQSINLVLVVTYKDVPSSLRQFYDMVPTAQWPAFFLAAALRGSFLNSSAAIVPSK